MQIQKASQLLWSTVPYPASVDSSVCVELVFSWYIWHIEVTFWIPYSMPPTRSCYTQRSSYVLISERGLYSVLGKSLFSLLIVEISSGNLKTLLTIPSSLNNGHSYRLQSHYVLDCCGWPCLSMSNCGRMWCLLCPPDAYKLMIYKEHSACFLALPSIGILFRGNGSLSGTFASTVTCLMVIGRQLTIWNNQRNVQRAFSLPLLLGVKGRVAESSK